MFFFNLQGVIVLNLSVRVILETVTPIIIHMKKLLDFDWLRTVQFKCKTAKSVIHQCKKCTLCNTTANYPLKFWIMIG